MLEVASAWASRWAPGARPEVLWTRGDVLVIGQGPVVVKVHHAGTEPAELAARLAFASGAPDVFVAPLAPLENRDGRVLSVWPRAHVLGVDDLDAAPWADLGRLAATLHCSRVAPVAPASFASPAQQATRSLPAARAPRRVTEAIERLRAQRPLAPAHRAARDVVLAAAGALPAWTVGDSPEPAGHVVVHGDLHLGQLARVAGGPWRLLDVDDLGFGAPAWDLARPAAWFAAGVLDPADWTTFLRAYREAGGPAVPPDGDPWPWLDATARALAVQTAARAVLDVIHQDRELDDVAESFVRASARIIQDAQTGTT